MSVDIRAPKGGKVKVQLAKEGETVKVGDSLAEIDTDDQEGAGKKEEAAAKEEKPKPAEKSAEQPADKSHIKEAHPPQQAGKQEREGTPVPSPTAQPGAIQPEGSTTQPGSKQQDKPATPTPTAAKLTTPSAAPSSAAKPAPSITVSPPAPGSHNVRRVPMSRMRQTIAARLKAAQNTAAMLTTFNEIDMTNIIELRNKYKDEFLEKTGVKLGFMSAFVKAATAALLKYPDVNASIEGNEIVYHDYVDISVAVSTPTGLVVPVLRNCETMNFAQIEAAIAALGAKARKGQIALEDMTGGTFTISNGGVYGSLFGTPIINPPQSAILGMHATFKRPIALNDSVAIRPMMYIALTYDHRLIDGSTAVQFLKEIKFNVEDPARLLLSI